MVILNFVFLNSQFGYVFWEHDFHAVYVGDIVLMHLKADNQLSWIRSEHIMSMKHSLRLDLMSLLLGCGLQASNHKMSTFWRDSKIYTHFLVHSPGVHNLLKVISNLISKLERVCMFCIYGINVPIMSTYHFIGSDAINTKQFMSMSRLNYYCELWYFIMICHFVVIAYYTTLILHS